MPPLMEISVVPTGKEGASLGDTTVKVLRVIQKHGLKYELNAMGTTIEGDLDALFAVAREMHEACFGMGYPRVITVIKLDDRRDKYLTMRYKVESVQKKMGTRSGAGR